MPTFGEKCFYVFYGKSSSVLYIFLIIHFSAKCPACFSENLISGKNLFLEFIYRKKRAKFRKIVPQVVLELLLTMFSCIVFFFIWMRTV